MPHMGSMGRQDSVIYRETGGERGGHIWGGLIAPRDAPHKSPLSADVPPAPHRSLRETRCGEREGGRERDEEIKGGGGGRGHHDGDACQNLGWCTLEPRDWVWCEACRVLAGRPNVCQ